jgi:hypothetical protein
MEVKYPNITVVLVGTDGNALSIVGKVKRALMREGVSDMEIDEFFNDALSGDYDHVLQTCMKWVNVE